MAVINKVNKRVHKREIQSLSDFDFSDIIKEIIEWDERTKAYPNRADLWGQESSHLNNIYQSQLVKLRQTVIDSYKLQQDEVGILVEQKKISQEEANKRNQEITKNYNKISYDEKELGDKFNNQLKDIANNIKTNNTIGSLNIINGNTAASQPAEKPSPNPSNGKVGTGNSTAGNSTAGNSTAGNSTTGNSTTGKGTANNGTGNKGEVVSDVAAQPTVVDNPTSSIPPTSPNTSGIPDNNPNTSNIPANSSTTVDGSNNNINKSSDIGESNGDRGVSNPDSVDNNNEGFPNIQEPATIQLLCIIVIAIVAVACAAVFVIKRRKKARQLRAEFNMKNDYDSNDLEAVSENPRVITESIINVYANDYTQSEDQEGTYNYGDNQPTNVEISSTNDAEYANTQEDYAFTPQYSIANVSGMENSYYHEGTMQVGGQPLPVSPSSKERDLNIDDFIPLIKSK